MIDKNYRLRIVEVIFVERLGFGLIGTGLWGEMHAKTYALSDEVELKAVCDVCGSRFWDAS